MKYFLYTLGIVASIGFYLIVFAVMYVFTQKDALEIIAVDLIIIFPIVMFVAGNIEKIVRRLKNGKFKN